MNSGQYEIVINKLNVRNLDYTTLICFIVSHTTEQKKKLRIIISLLITTVINGFKYSNISYRHINHTVRYGGKNILLLYINNLRFGNQIII